MADEKKSAEKSLKKAAPKASKAAPKIDPLEASLAAAKARLAKRGKTFAPLAAPRVLTPCDAQAFVRASGKRPEQMAGFLSWAKREGLGYRTMDAWADAYAQFSNAPTL